MTKLPVFRTTARAYLFVWNEKWDLAKLVWPGGLVVGAVLILFHWQTDQIPNILANTGRVLALALFGFVVQFAIYIIYAVAWHRKYLLPEVQWGVRGAYVWQRNRQTRFLFAYIKFAIIAVFMLAPVIAVVIFIPVIAAAAKSLVVASATPVAVVILWILSALLICRFSPALPGAAIEGPLGVSDSIELSKGNAWRLLIMFLLAMGPFWALAFVIDLLAQSYLFDIDDTSRRPVEAFRDAVEFSKWLAVGCVEFVIWTFGAAVATTAVSIAYKHLIANPPESLAEKLSGPSTAA